MVLKGPPSVVSSVLAGAPREARGRGWVRKPWPSPATRRWRGATRVRPLLPASAARWGGTGRPGTGVRLRGGSGLARRVVRRLFRVHQRTGRPARLWLFRPPLGNKDSRAETKVRVEGDAKTLRTRAEPPSKT